MFIFPLVVIFAAYIAAILSVGIVVAAKLNIVLGIVAFCLVVLFPFFAGKDSCSRLGYLIWNGSIIVCSIIIYGWYSLLIFAVWGYWIYQWRNVNGRNPFTLSEFAKLFSWRRKDNL